jgi:carboxylesterase type B
LATTSYGTLQGFSQQLFDGKATMDVFLGVPYAQSPKGELRFEAFLFDRIFFDKFHN